MEYPMPENVKDFLAKRVRERRREAGISQEILADRSGLSLALISEIERSATNPSLTTLAKLAKGLGLSIAEMLDQEEYLDSGERIMELIQRNLKALNPEQLKIVLALIRITQK